MVDEMHEVKRRVEALEIENALLREVVTYTPSNENQKEPLLTVTGDLVVNNKTKLNGITTKCKTESGEDVDFDLSGPDLTVPGKLNINESATFNKNVECQDTLTVQGATALVGPTTAQDVKVERGLAVYGTTNLYEDVTAHRTATIKEHMRLHCVTVAPYDTSIEPDAFPKPGELRVFNATMLDGTLNVNKEATFASDTTVSGNVVAKSKVNVEGNLTAEADALVKGDTVLTGMTTCEGGLGVKSAATVMGPTTLLGDLKCDGEANMNSNTNIKGDLHVDGKSDMGDTVLFHNGYM